MFYILIDDSVPFASDMPRAVAKCEKAENLASTLHEVRTAHPGEPLIVVEQLFALHMKNVSVKVIPPELERAVEAWNHVAERVTPKLPKIRVVANYVAPYRRWKKRAAERTYLLEAVAAKILHANPEWFQWLNFGWLFGEKNGTLNSDKIMHDRIGVREASAEKPAFRKTAKKEE